MTQHRSTFKETSKCRLVAQFLPLLILTTNNGWLYSEEVLTEYK